MESMNISLSEPLKQFVDAQIAEGPYGSVSEYVSALIRADEKRKTEEQNEKTVSEDLHRAEEAEDPDFS